MDIEKLIKQESDLIKEAEKKRGDWIVSLSCGEIKRVGQNFDYDIVFDYLNDWRDGRTFDNFNNEVLVHVLLNNYLYELEDGSADRKAYNSTLRRLRDRKRELEEDIEVTNKELE